MMQFGTEKWQKLKLSSKRLQSGRVQVKFELYEQGAQRTYGYLLAEPQESLREVVARIGQYCHRAAAGYQPHLYCVGRHKQDTGILMFK